MSESDTDGCSELSDASYGLFEDDDEWQRLPLPENGLSLNFFIYVPDWHCEASKHDSREETCVHGHKRPPMHELVAEALESFIAASPDGWQHFISKECPKDILAAAIVHDHFLSKAVLKERWDIITCVLLALPMVPEEALVGRRTLMHDIAFSPAVATEEMTTACTLIANALAVVGAINERDKWTDITALHAAAMMANTVVLQALVEAGADTGVAHEDWLPIDAAIHCAWRSAHCQTLRRMSAWENTAGVKPHLKHAHVVPTGAVAYLAKHTSVFAIERAVMRFELGRCCKPKTNIRLLLTRELSTAHRYFIVLVLQDRLPPELIRRIVMFIN